MSQENIIRAWKDAEFRNSLSQEERALLPEHPVGIVELVDADLKDVVGGAIPRTHCECRDSTCHAGSCV
jgi:mersacidin/lichenicidin family type 2 lantibiotic